MEGKVVVTISLAIVTKDIFPLKDKKENNLRLLTLSIYKK